MVPNPERLARLWPVEQRMAQQLPQWKKVRPGTQGAEIFALKALHGPATRLEC